MKKKLSILSLLLILGIGTIVAQTTVPLPPQTSVFGGLTRGYWFTAPNDFVITSLNVPTDASSDPQSIAVVKFAAPPTAWPVTTSAYTTEAIFQNVPGSTPIAVNIQVSTGDIIGVLGSRGSAVNSYGPSPFASDILGVPITMARLGIQANLASSWPFPIFTEPGGSIGRIVMTVSPAGAIPTMGEWGLIILALLVLSFGTVFMMRRRMVIAGMGEASVSQGGGIPFDQASFGKMLVAVMVGLVAVFTVSVLVFGYEMTNADVPGSLIAAPIAAYLLHLLFGEKK